MMPADYRECGFRWRNGDLHPDFDHECALDPGHEGDHECCSKPDGITPQAPVSTSTGTNQNRSE